MNEKLVKHLTNPVNNRLIIEVLAQGTATAKSLASTNKNIPQATLYRHLNKMVADGIFKVVEERQIRNVTEKVYALAFDLKSTFDKMIEENDGEAYLALFQQFTIGLLSEYHKYCTRSDIDILKDGSGFRTLPIYATYDELETLSKDIWKLIEPYATRVPTADIKTRSVAVIFTPPT